MGPSGLFGSSVQGVDLAYATVKQWDAIRSWCRYKTELIANSGIRDST